MAWVLLSRPASADLLYSEVQIYCHDDRRRFNRCRRLERVRAAGPHLPDPPGRGGEGGERRRKQRPKGCFSWLCSPLVFLPLSRWGGKGGGGRGGRGVRVRAGEGEASNLPPHPPRLGHPP